MNDDRALVAILAVLVAFGSSAWAGAQESLDFSGPRRADGALVPGIAHQTHDLTHQHRFALTIDRLVIHPQSAIPARCRFEPGTDAAVVHLTITNRGRRPFAGIVESFVIVWTLRGTEDGIDADQDGCGLGDRLSRFRGELSPPIPVGGRRRARILFAVPTGAALIRLNYEDDDRPTRFGLPAPIAARTRRGARE